LIVLLAGLGYSFPMKYLESKQTSGSRDLVVFIHGLEASKTDWITPGGFTSGGNLTALLDEAGIPWAAADLYGHGDWHAVESEFDPSDISDELWDSFVSRSVEALNEMVLSYREKIPGCTLQLVSYSVGCVILTSYLAACPGVPVSAVHLASPVPQESMDDEYSLHNNAGLFKNRKLYWHCGNHDEENGEGEIDRVFALIPSENKTLYRYDSGHALPVSWTRTAFRDISASLVDSNGK